MKPKIASLIFLLLNCSETLAKIRRFQVICLLFFNSDDYFIKYLRFRNINLVSWILDWENAQVEDAFDPATWWWYQYFFIKYFFFKKLS